MIQLRTRHLSHPQCPWWRWMILHPRKVGLFCGLCRENTQRTRQTPCPKMDSSIVNDCIHVFLVFLTVSFPVIHFQIIRNKSITSYINPVPFCEALSSRIAFLSGLHPLSWAYLTKPQQFPGYTYSVHPQGMQMQLAESDGSKFQ